MDILLIVDDRKDKWRIGLLKEDLASWNIQFIFPAENDTQDTIIDRILQINPKLLILDQQLAGNIRGSELAVGLRNKCFQQMIVFDSSDKSYLQIISSVDGRELNQDHKYDHLKDLTRDAITYKFTQTLPIVISNSRLLAALYLLCQGYLAAHGGVGLESWKDVKNEKHKEVSQSRKALTESVVKWWRAVKESPTIEQEIRELGLKTRLVDKIRGVSGTPLIDVTDTSLVEEAYQELCKPENLGRFL